MDRKNELRRLINEARESYYNLTPTISDQQYDAWIDELKKISPNDEEVIAVGAKPPQISVWEKVKHEIQMGSLGKVNSEKELDDWASKIQNDNGWHITHKIDGSSMELVYDNGKLIRCVTRGDGVIGEDVTYNVSKIPSIPKSINDINVIIRGEIVMFKDVFIKKYSEEYANPRNTAAGKVREKKGDGEACKDLEFLAYWVYIKDSNDKPKTMNDVMNWLKEHGFKIPLNKSGKELSVMKSSYMEETAKRNEIPYEIDGMVISVNNLEVIEEMGSINGRPRGQIAWKFDPAMKETSVIDIKWQVGPSGRICPVMKVEPVEVGGVVINSVSLHNLAIFKDLKLFKGCRVLISRRNDVIPYCERNLSIEH